MNKETTPLIPPAYLGDGVYASFDGYSITLKANDFHNPTDTIVLEPQVLMQLEEYIQRIKDEI